MYQAHLFGGPLDGQTFKVPLVLPTITVGQHTGAQGYTVLETEFPPEANIEQHVYLREGNQGSHYRYRYQGIRVACESG